MANKTTREQENFIYRLRTHQLSESMVNILKALDDWTENNPSAATCQDIADLAGVHQTYIQRVIKCLESEGFVKLWRHRKSGILKCPGVFILKGWKSIHE